MWLLVVVFVSTKGEFPFSNKDEPHNTRAGTLWFLKKEPLSLDAVSPS
jgi:hypothetical protein